MSRKLLFLLCALLLVAGGARAQDGLNLPTELYVLTNAGQVQRYGIGAAGITTVTPEDEFVLDFGVAPDGSWLAYRTETALNLLNMSSGESLVIENTASVPSARGRGDTLAWSPSGDALAYTTLYGGRVYFSGSSSPVFLDLRESVFISLGWSPEGSYLAAQTEPNIWWLYRRDGDNLILTSAIPSSQGLAWLSDSQVIFAPDEGGLIRMDLANLNTQTVLLDNTSVYAWPFVVPDGSLSVFARTKDAEQPDSGQLFSLDPAQPKAQAAGDGTVDLNGLRWVPDGQFMVAFRGGVMALVLPATGEGFTLPISDAVAYGWGPPPLDNLASIRLSANGYFLTPDTDGIVQVWRLRKEGALAEPVTQAESNVTEYALSPNERTVAYASAGQVWGRGLNGSADAQALAQVGSHEVRDLTFSPDGTRVAFTTLGTAEEPEGGIWVVSAQGGDAELILRNGPGGGSEPVYAPPFYRQPQFAPNVNALLVAIGGGETTTFGILDLGTRTLLDIGFADEALWLGNGRLLVFGNGIGVGDPPPTQELVSINPADLTRTPLASIAYPERIVSWRDLGSGKVRLVVGNYRPGPQILSVLDLNVENGALLPVAASGFIAQPAISADGNFIAGQRQDGGLLTFRDLLTGKQVLVTEPSQITAFQWGR